MFKEEGEVGHSSGTCTSLPGVTDILRPARHSEGHSVSLALVNIKVRTQCRRKVLGNTALEDFLCGLMSDGFVQMGHDGELMLSLLQSPLLALEESLVSAQEEFFEQDTLTPQLEVSAVTVETDRVVFPVLGEAPLDKDFDHTVQSEAPCQGDASESVEDAADAVEASVVSTVVVST